MKIIDIKVNSIVPYDNNPRHNEDAVNAVCASIRSFGFKVPLVLDTNMVIVCGHTRHAAAQKLGLETVPCIIADWLQPEQVKALRLADNKTAELASWDMDKLQQEIEKITSLDMERFGFENIGAELLDPDGWEPGEKSDEPEQVKPEGEGRRICVCPRCSRRFEV